MRSSSYFSLQCYSKADSVDQRSECTFYSVIFIFTLGKGICNSEKHFWSQTSGCSADILLITVTFRFTFDALVMAYAICHSYIINVKVFSTLLKKKKTHFEIQNEILAHETEIVYAICGLNTMKQQLCCFKTCL